MAPCGLSTRRRANYAPSRLFQLTSHRPAKSRNRSNAAVGPPEWLLMITPALASTAATRVVGLSTAIPDANRRLTRDFDFPGGSHLYVRSSWSLPGASNFWHHGASNRNPFNGRWIVIAFIDDGSGLSADHQGDFLYAISNYLQEMFPRRFGKPEVPGLGEDGIQNHDVIEAIFNPPIRQWELPGMMIYFLRGSRDPRFEGDAGRRYARFRQRSLRL